MDDSDSEESYSSDDEDDEAFGDDDADFDEEAGGMDFALGDSDVDDEF